MDQQPDKLFRGKLKDYKKPAPAGSWNRIAGKLHKKNNRGIWLKAAAAILLLAVAGILLFPTQDEPVKKVIAEKVTPLEKEEKTSRINEIPPVKNPAPPLPDKKTFAVPDKKKSEVQTKSTQRKDRIAPATLQQAQEHKLPLASAEIIPEENPEKNVVVVNEPVAEPTSENDRSITLVYSADEVNEKYLNKNAVAEATSDEKPSSTLRKLLDKAYDLKHNQDPLGELRQKKNEILALNFRSDKQRSQNK